MCIVSTAGRQSGGCSVFVGVIIHTATAALQHCMQTADSGLASLHGIFAFDLFLLSCWWIKHHPSPGGARYNQIFTIVALLLVISTIVMSVEFNFDININIRNVHLALKSAFSLGEHSSSKDP